MAQRVCRLVGPCGCDQSRACCSCGHYHGSTTACRHTVPQCSCTLLVDRVGTCATCGHLSAMHVGAERKNKIRGVEDTKKSVPAAFLCPLTRKIMTDPYMLTGSCQTFEKKAIEARLRVEDECPVTAVWLNTEDSRKLLPNVALKKAIQEYLGLGHGDPSPPQTRSLFVNKASSLTLHPLSQPERRLPATDSVRVHRVGGQTRNQEEKQETPSELIRRIATERRMMSDQWKKQDQPEERVTLTEELRQIATELGIDTEREKPKQRVTATDILRRLQRLNSPKKERVRELHMRC